MEEIHPSQRRLSCELCRKHKTKCQRIQPDDIKCIRCTLANVLCDSGQQRKVGRPKRKEFASSSTLEKPPVTKRHKQSTDTRTRVAATSRPENHDSLLAQDVPDFPDIRESTTGIRTAEDGVFGRYDGAQSAAFTPLPMSQDSDWLGWPTVMTDRWCLKMFPGAARGRVLTDTDICASSNADPAQPTIVDSNGTLNNGAYNPSPTLPELTDQAIVQGSLAWTNPGFRTNTLPASNDGLVRKKDPLPFGIYRPPAYYVHENSFSTNPRDVVLSGAGTDGSGAMVRLLSIVYGLRLRSTMVHINRLDMNLSLIIHRKGPLFIGEHSLAEYVMVSTQELIHIVGSLVNQPLSTRKHDEKLSACLVATITDVYCRLLSFFEIFLEHLTDRAERYAVDPVIPIPGLTSNGTILTGPCAQGVLFSSTTYHLLAKLEDLLGLETMSGGHGLLSPDQIESLCSKLDGSDDLAQSRGIMRPADVKKLFAQVATVLERLAVNE
jgi:hypothetical protein